MLHLVLMLLILGFRIPTRNDELQVVAAVDLSQSICGSDPAQRGLQDVADVLEKIQIPTQAGVIAFAKTAGIERPLTPLPGAAKEGLAPWPNLAHPQSNPDPDATNIGGALDFARGQLPPEDKDAGAAQHRAVVLISDGLDNTGHAATAAKLYAGTGIDLLIYPVAPRASGDVRVAALQVPDDGYVGRGVPISVVIEGQAAQTVEVKLERQSAGPQQTVGTQLLDLKPISAMKGALCRGVANFTDHPTDPGAARYIATVEAPPGKTLAGDFKNNNRLQGAVRIHGPSRWAVLANRDHALAQLLQAQPKAFGVETEVFLPGSFPTSVSDYRGFSGVLVDSLSAQALPEGSPALTALTQAQQSGLGIVALGGPDAFGAGKHLEDGAWEKLLPVTMEPDDDRARVIVFLVDISRSMEDKVGQGSKLQYVQEQLGPILNKIRPTDHIGLITFSGEAHANSPLLPVARKNELVETLSHLNFENKTDFLGPLEAAQKMLIGDESEERLIFLISDGVQTTGTPLEKLQTAVSVLCPPPPSPAEPRRTRLFTIGIGTSLHDREEAGELLLRALSNAGGGSHSPDFLDLGKIVQGILDQTKHNLYSRVDSYRVSQASAHPVSSVPQLAGSTQRFRNRFKLRTESQALLWSAPSSEKNVGEKVSHKPDPLLVLGHRNLGRCVALSFTLDGAPGSDFLNANGVDLLSRTLSWAESRADDAAKGLTLDIDAEAQNLVRVTIRAARELPDGAKEPWNGRELFCRLYAVNEQGGSSDATGSKPLSTLTHGLWPIAPGVYQAELPAPDEGVYRLELLEHETGKPASELRTLDERFVTVPYAPELRKFGSDRIAMTEWTRMAGGGSRVINNPEKDFAEWMNSLEARRAYTNLRPYLLILAAMLLVAEAGYRLRLKA